MGVGQETLTTKALNDSAFVVLTDQETVAAGSEYIGTTAGSAVEAAVVDPTLNTVDPSSLVELYPWEYSYEIDLSNHSLTVNDLKQQLFEAAYAGDFRFNITGNILTTNDPLIVATMLRVDNVAV